MKKILALALALAVMLPFGCSPAARGRKPLPGGGEMTALSGLVCSEGERVLGAFRRDAESVVCACGKNGALRVFIYDLYTGKSSGETLLDVPKHEVFWFDAVGRDAAVISGSDSDFYFAVSLADAGCRRIDVPADLNGNCVFSGDGLTCWFAEGGEDGGGRLCRYTDGDSGIEVLRAEEGCSYSVGALLFGRYLAASRSEDDGEGGREPRSFFYDAETGGDLACAGDAGYYYSSPDGSALYMGYDSEPQEVKVFSGMYDSSYEVLRGPEGSWLSPGLIDLENGLCMTSEGVYGGDGDENGSVTLFLYETGDMARVCQYAREDGYAFPTGMTCETGRGWICVNVVDGETPYDTDAWIWDLNRAEYGRQTPASPLQPGQTATMSSVRERAEAIGETYGVTVLVGDEAVRYFPEYAVSASNDPETLSEALDRVDEALSLYPTGFLEAAGKHGDVDGIRIYLTAGIHSSESTLHDTGGFAVEYAGAEHVVLRDTSPTLAADLVHELCHVTDNYLFWFFDVYGGLYADSAAYDECFKDVNPEGFSYYYGYLDENGADYRGSPQYTASYEAQAGDVYFIDPYSKTYPREDRARIFETMARALRGETGTEVFASPHIQAKMEIMARAIRAAFDSGGWEGAFWEDFMAKD